MCGMSSVLQFAALSFVYGGTLCRLSWSGLPRRRVIVTQWDLFLVKERKKG